MRAIGEADMVQGRKRLLSPPALRPRGVQRAEDRADRLLAELAGDADHHVVERGQVGEQPQVLEGARDAGVHDRLRPQAVEPAAAKRDAALVRLQEAGDDVEDRGLARAVRTDQAGDAALLDGEAAILQRMQSAEAMVEAGDLQIRGHSRSPARPCGRNSMNAISSTP